MSSQPPLSEYLRFLYRSEQGRVGKRAWWQGVAILAAILMVFSLGWRLVAPFANRGLDERAMLDPMTITAYSYSMVYALVILLCAVSYTMLTIKRMRDRGRSTVWAGLVPLMVFLSGATHWLQPRVKEVMSYNWVYGIDLLMLAAIIWTIFDIGMHDQKAPAE